MLRIDFLSFLGSPLFLALFFKTSQKGLVGVMSISLFGLSQTWPLAMWPLMRDCETEFLILFEPICSYLTVLLAGVNSTGQPVRTLGSQL